MQTSEHNPNNSNAQAGDMAVEPGAAAELERFFDELLAVQAAVRPGDAAILRRGLDAALTLFRAVASGAGGPWSGSGWKARQAGDGLALNSPAKPGWEANFQFDDAGRLVMGSLVIMDPAPEMAIVPFLHEDQPSGPVLILMGGEQERRVALGMPHAAAALPAIPAALPVAAPVPQTTRAGVAGCSRCGSANAPGVSFCGACGAHLAGGQVRHCATCGLPQIAGEQRCRKCEHVVRHGENFCSSCGERVIT
jgi:hypothetical protein